jgi:hypothetical protein
LLALVAPCYAFGQGEAAPAAPTDAIVRVNVDLAAGAFDRVLPFDVPFFIVGTPPGLTETLEVQYREVNKGGTAASVYRPVNDVPWRAIGPITADTRFAVLQRTPLEAERYYEYRFAFKKAPDAEFTKGFESIARRVIDTVLWNQPGTALSPSKAGDLRADLVNRITQRTKERRIEWVPRPTSLFDIEATSTAALVAFIDEANQVLKRQDDRQAVLQALTAVRPRLANAVTALHENGDLRAFLAACQGLTTAQMQELLKVDSEGVGLLGLSAEAARVLALGGTDIALDDMHLPEDVHARVEVYREVLRRLTQLRHVIQTAIDSKGLGPAVEKRTGSTVFSAVASLTQADGPLQRAIDDAFRAITDSGRLEANLKDRESALVALIQRLTVLLLDERFVEGTTVANGQTAQNNYISADGGLLYAGTIGAAALYVGTNFYLRPVNKDAPLSLVSSFTRRFAFTVGLTVSSIADEGSRRRADLFANQSLVLGAGYRVTPSIRVGGGALIYRKANDNPAITEKKPRPTWYTSLSFDLNVARGIQGLGGKWPQ